MFHSPVGNGMSVAVADLCLAAATVPAAARKRLQFLLENRLDQSSNILPQPILDRATANRVGQ